MTSYWAGPLAGHVLALLGAEVIHLESSTRPDGARLVGGVPQTEDRYWERGPIFAALNTNKKSLTIDFRDERGIELLHRVIATCDVVIENYTPRVLDQLGLDYDTLRIDRPDLIMLRMPGFGLEGPWRDQAAFAFVIEDASGLTWLTGHPDLLPFEPYCVGDPNAGLHALFGLLLALEHRERTGEGGLVEAAMVEAAANVAAEQAIEFSAYGALLEQGREPRARAAPQNLYQSAGPDEHGRDDSLGRDRRRHRRAVAALRQALASRNGRPTPRCALRRAGARARPDRRPSAGVVPGPFGRRYRRAAVGCRRPGREGHAAPRPARSPQFKSRQFFEELRSPGDRIVPLQHAPDAVLPWSRTAARAARAAARRAQRRVSELGSASRSRRSTRSKQTGSSVARSSRAANARARAAAILPGQGFSPAPFDVVEASRRVWLERWEPEAASGMAVFTAILRSYQLLNDQVNGVMKSHDFTFARYEVLAWLATDPESS